MITKRVMKVWRAVVGSGLTTLEVNNAEALLDVEREELRKKVGQYNLGLAGYAAISEKLKRTLLSLDREREQVEAKLRMRMEAGDRVSASRLALRLEAIDEQRAAQQSQRQETENTYRELTQAREVALVQARDRIDSLKREVGDLRVQETLADLTEMAAGMRGAIGLSDTMLERVQEGVSDKRNLAVGRVRVARDAFDSSDSEQREAEQQAMADAALRRFEQRIGSTPIAIDPLT